MEWKEPAAKLAALGLPILGKALGTLVGGQIPIFGDMIEGAGENIGIGAAKMIADALGVEPTPEAINNAIETQPTTQVVQALQTAESEAAAKWPALAEMVRAREEGATERFRIGTADNADARALLPKLIETKSPIAWAPIVVTTIVLVGYFTVVYLLFAKPLGKIEDNFKDIMLIMLGGLIQAFGQTIQYWLGSSAGSALKDHAMRDITATSVVAAAAAAPPPAPTKPKR